MAQLFIIDHSLKDSGGHHFDYAHCMVRAAVDRGWQPIVATNRSFQDSSWNQLSAGDLNHTTTGPPKVLPVFRHTTYQPDSYLAGLQQITRSQSATALEDRSDLKLSSRLIRRARFLWHHRRREWFVRQFAVDCHSLFQRCPLQPGDHVFLTTISELELMGLCLFLANHQPSLDCHWHLQFHFNLFQGRPIEYRRQALIGDAINACFLASLSRLNDHSLHFYTTSETLADQYNLLDVGEFHSLPYPIAPEFEPDRMIEPRLIKFNAAPAYSSAPSIWTHPEIDDSKDSSAVEVGRPNDPFTNVCPLRLTCPGGIRREKGQAHYLQNVIDQLWDSHFATGDLQLVLQRPVPKWPRKAHKFDLEYPETDTGLDFPPVLYDPHPLPQREYIDLIRQTDIGLLHYDQDTYFSRRAGVLGELLSCGKPVIVSAGTWLADQIQEPNHRYLGIIEKSLPIGEKLGLDAMSWSSANIPLPGGVVSFDQCNHPFKATCEHHGGSLGLLEFDWHWPRTHGTYCRIKIEQICDRGMPIEETVQIVGQRRAGRSSRLAFRLSSQTQRLSLKFTNAFDDSTTSIRNLNVKVWKLEDPQAFPLGSVGMIAADENQIADCVSEVVAHYQHYRESAFAFAKNWYARHDPHLTLDYLLSVDQQAERQVA